MNKALVTINNDEIDEEMMQSIMDDVDKDGDNEISFEEFVLVAHLTEIPPNPEDSDSDEKPEYELEFLPKAKVQVKREENFKKEVSKNIEDSVKKSKYTTITKEEIKKVVEEYYSKNITITT
jgi:hypothetical protein